MNDISDELFVKLMNPNINKNSPVEWLDVLTYELLCQGEGVPHDIRELKHLRDKDWEVVKYYLEYIEIGQKDDEIYGYDLDVNINVLYNDIVKFVAPKIELLDGSYFRIAESWFSRAIGPTYKAIMYISSRSQYLYDYGKSVITDGEFPLVSVYEPVTIPDEYKIFEFEYYINEYYNESKEGKFTLTEEGRRIASEVHRIAAKLSSGEMNKEEAIEEIQLILPIESFTQREKAVAFIKKSENNKKEI